MRIEGKTFKADASIKKPTRSRLFYWGNFVGHWEYIRQALLRGVALVAYQPRIYVIAYPAGSHFGRLSGGESLWSPIRRGFT